MKPLEHIRVVDVTEGAQGPYAVSLLGDLGAEVVKIERPGGELMRRSGPFVEGLALPCLSICRSRAASIVLDLKSASDLELIHALVASADIFVQNWKIGTDARLGLSFEQCRALNPRIVYVRSSGFGARGPFAEEGSMDMLSQAACGMAGVSGEPGTSGERTRTPILDFISAFSASEAALIGLYERDRTGEAQLVDTSQLAAGLDALGPELATSNQMPITPCGRTSRHYRYGGMYETADGAWLAIECVTEAQEKAAESLLGTPEAVADAVQAKSAADLQAALAKAGIPCAVVQRRFTADVIDARPGNLQRYVDLQAGEIRYPDVPWIFSATPVRAGVPLGTVGRDTPMLPGLLRRWAAANAAEGAATTRAAAE